MAVHLSEVGYWPKDDVFGAMVSGDTIGVVNLHKFRCARCELVGIGEGPLCKSCVENPLFDHAESGRLLGGQAFDFMGWKFEIRESHSAHCPVPLTYLFCYKRLFNPEKPGEVYSTASSAHDDFSKIMYRDMPARLMNHKKKRCAAWLIAHWYEHLLEICPCLKGERNDEEDSNFRRAVVSALLWYDENL